MKKLGRNTLALGMSTLLITSAVALSANAADEPVAQSNSSASTGTGLFSSLQLDTGTCEAIFPEDPEGRCGSGLDTNAIDAFNQEATAEGTGNSAASASVSPIDLSSLETALDLSDLVLDISEIDTGTILDGVLGGVADAVLTVLNLLGLDTVVDTIDDVLGTVLGGVDGALPIELQVGAVNAQCTATPTGAAGSSTVAGVDLVISLGGQQIVAPVVAETSENQNLLVGAPQELVDGILEGLRDTLDQSLGGALGALNILLVGLEDLLVDPLLDALEPTVLQAVSDLLAPVVTGTVNAQELSDDGRSIEVSALQLTLLGAENQLDLARVNCGPNAGPTAVDDEAAAGDDTPADDSDAQADGTIADAQADAQADAIADADAQADADVTTSLPNAGAPNLLPFWLLGLGLVAFGAAVLVNERRRALI